MFYIKRFNFTDKSKGNNKSTEKVFVQVLDVNDNVPVPLNESRILTLCQNNHNTSQVFIINIYIYILSIIDS